MIVFWLCWLQHSFCRLICSFNTSSACNSDNCSRLSSFCSELIRFINYCRHPWRKISLSPDMRFLIFIVANPFHPSVQLESHSAQQPLPQLIYHFTPFPLVGSMAESANLTHFCLTRGHKSEAENKKYLKTLFPF